MKYLWTLPLFLLGYVSPALAMCAAQPSYYCVPVVFESANPNLKQKDASPGQCAGYVGWGDKHAAVIFKSTGTCPTTGTHLVGHLESICQDTGKWTEATHWFAVRPDSCQMDYKQRMNQARLDARMIRPGVPRNQVHEILKGYEFMDGSFVERYYGHPGVVIQVPFDQPGGIYGDDNRVRGRVSVKPIVMPKP